MAFFEQDDVFIPLQSSSTWLKLTGSNWSKAVEQVNFVKTSCEGRAVIHQSCSILLMKNCKNLSHVSVELFIWEAGEIFRAESVTEKRSRGLLELFSIILAKDCVGAFHSFHKEYFSLSSQRTRFGWWKTPNSLLWSWSYIERHTHHQSFRWLMKHWYEWSSYQEKV